MDRHRVPALVSFLAQVPDCRQRQGQRHPLVALLSLVCVALLSGARSERAIAEWLEYRGEPWRSRLGFTHPDGPSQPTVHRVLVGLDVRAVEAALSRWAHAVMAQLPAPAGAPPDAVAIDGKTLRASARAGAVDTHLLSAVHQRLGIVLAQLGVADKTNEIGACDALLEHLLLEGLVVTTDALLTQQDLARQIRSAGGDYLMEVKENQPTLYEDLTILFADPDAPMRTARSVDLHGGRIEQRSLRLSTEVVGYSTWPDLAQVGCLERTVIAKATGQVSCERRYAVLSLGPQQVTPAQVLTIWREHWHCENKLHWVRDVTFGEDASRIRGGHAPQVMAALRNAVIGVVRLANVTNVAASCRQHAAQPALALAAIGL